MAKSIKELNIKGKKLFIRVDFNVPVKDGVVKDDTRIVEALKTIRYAKKMQEQRLSLLHIWAGQKGGKKSLR